MPPTNVTYDRNSQTNAKRKPLASLTKGTRHRASMGSPRTTQAINQVRLTPAIANTAGFRLGSDQSTICQLR